MKTEVIKLSELPLNEKGIIKQVKCEENIKRRLLDLGLVKGTNIIPILISPSNDPRAFCTRGSTIAIREEDARNIEISKLKN